MNKAKLIATVLSGGGVSSVALPYTFDPSALGDGSLPSDWTGPTYSVSSGKIINTPTLESELLTDTGLETAYAAGLCGSLTKTGSPTLADETSDVHGGSHAQSFTAVAVQNNVYKSITPTANRWVVGKTWAKRTAGTGGTVHLYMFQTGGLNSGAGPTFAVQLTDAAWTQKEASFWTNGTGTLFHYPARELNSSAFDTVLVDDVSMKYMTLANGFATVETMQSNVAIKLRMTHPSRAMLQGGVARLDSIGDPQNYIMAWIQRHNTTANWLYGSIAEVSSGVMTILLNQTYIGAITDATLVTKDVELRVNGTSANLWYDGVQKGATVTTSITSGTRHGLFGVGGAGNSCSRFFCGSNLIEMLVGFGGSSLTANGTTGYRLKVMSGMSAAWQNYDFVFETNAVSGHGTFSTLVQLSDLAGDELIIADVVGANNVAQVEALVRRLWGASQRFICVITPTWTGALDDSEINTPQNQTLITNIMAMLDVYGVDYVNLWGLLQTHVAGGGHIADWYTDYIHMSDAGYTAIANNMLDNYLPLGGAVGSLPARQEADTANYENTPTRKNGTAYDSKTGTWTESGTQVSSSTEGSTVVYSGTFRFIGCWRIDGGTNTVEIDIDGGGFASHSFYQYPYDLGTQAAHTVTIRIPAGGNCTIDEFWAI